ncbi:hypothetical protein [Pontibacter rugosus]
MATPTVASLFFGRSIPGVTVARSTSMRATALTVAGTTAEVSFRT